MRLSRRQLKERVVLDVRVVRGSGGGPDKTILNSPRFLQPLGYRNVCAYMHPADDRGFEQLRRKARTWHAPLVSIPESGPWDARVLPRLLNVCRRERVAIWHGHDYKSNLLGILLKRFWPMHLVTTVHGWVHHTNRTPLYYRLDRLCLPQYEQVICVSPDLHEQCLAAGVPSERCCLVENGIDTKEFAPRYGRVEAKGRLGFPTGRLLVGAVGRLSAEKGFDLLIHAIAQLVRDGMDVEACIVGEGDEGPRLDVLIRELGLADRIRLLGYRSDLRELYEAMDLFVLSSIREGLPNVLLEAMAMETPVLATRIAGVPRLVRDGMNGLVVTPGSTDELVHGMRSLLTDSQLRRQFAQAGRATIEREYSFAVRMEKIRDLYDSMLGMAPASPHFRLESRTPLVA